MCMQTSFDIEKEKQYNTNVRKYKRNAVSYTSSYMTAKIGKVLK